MTLINRSGPTWGRCKLLANDPHDDSWFDQGPLPLSEGNPQNSWSILLEAGHHPRHGIPVSVPVPIVDRNSLGPPLLVRDGRKRPIACQWDWSGNELHAVWLVDSMRKGEQYRYQLSIGERKRQSPARMHIEKSPAGWTVFDEELRLADYLAPARGAPRLTLYGPAGQLAVLQHNAMPRWLEKGTRARGTIEGERSLLRVLSSPLVSTSGPVFSSLRTEYDYVDPRDRKIIAETTQVRFYTAERGIRVVDLSVLWKASAEGLTLIDPNREAYQRLPAFRVQMTGPINEDILNDVGRRGTREVIDRVSSGVQVQQSGAKLGLLARSSTLGFPPVWECEGDSTLWIVPGVIDPHWLSAPIRLAIGETWGMNYRVVLSPAVAESVDEFSSFDVEPTVSIFAGGSIPS